MTEPEGNEYWVMKRRRALHALVLLSLVSGLVWALVIWGLVSIARGIA